MESYKEKAMSLINSASKLPAYRVSTDTLKEIYIALELALLDAGHEVKSNNITEAEGRELITKYDKDFIILIHSSGREFGIICQGKNEATQKNATAIGNVIFKTISVNPTKVNGPLIHRIGG